MNSISMHLSCAVLKDFSHFAGLEEDWRAIYEAMDAPYLSDSFEWARTSWDVVCRNKGRQLFLVAVGGPLGVIAILPLVVARRGLWRIATPLSSEGSEYCPFLIHPSADVAQVMAAIHGKLRRTGGLHGLLLPYVREDGPLGPWLASRADAVRLLTLPAGRIRFQGCADWDSYLATRSAGLRGEVRRKLRRAQALGDLQLCEITDSLERKAVWLWLIERKKATLRRRAMNDWLLTSHQVQFAAATLDRLESRRPLLAVKLDGEVIAAGLCSVGATCVEGFVMAYDERHGQISPGALLQWHCARWAFERGLDFDLRTGHEAFKSRWANEASRVSHYALPLTVWGRIYVAGERLRRGIGLRLPESLRARARRLLSSVGRSSQPETLEASRRP